MFCPEDRLPFFAKKNLARKPFATLQVIFFPAFIKKKLISDRDGQRKKGRKSTCLDLEKSLCRKINHMEPNCLQDKTWTKFLVQPSTVLRTLKVSNFSSLFRIVFEVLILIQLKQLHDSNLT